MTPSNDAENVFLWNQAAFQRVVQAGAQYEPEETAPVSDVATETSSPPVPEPFTIGTAIGNLQLITSENNAITHINLAPDGGLKNVVLERLDGNVSLTATGKNGREIHVALSKDGALHINGGLTEAELGLHRVQRVSLPPGQCEAPGCTETAYYGLRFCSSDCALHFNRMTCLLAGCGKPCTNDVWWWCDQHGNDEGDFAGVETVAESLLIERSFQGFMSEVADDEDDEDEEPVLPEGMPSVISTHGAPVEVDPLAMAVALMGMLPKCIQGNCGLVRVTGHAFCEGHLASIKRHPSQVPTCAVVRR
jgi:hypothetical protein